MTDMSTWTFRAVVPEHKSRTRTDVSSHMRGILALCALTREVTTRPIQVLQLGLDVLEGEADEGDCIGH